MLERREEIESTFERTNAKLNKMSDQEVFDTVARHLMQQGERSFPDRGTTCAYFGKEGEHGQPLKCAAGCLIDPEDYDPAIESNSWNVLVYHDVMTRAHCDLINRLQNLHDMAPIEDWRRGLMDICIAFNLSSTVLHEQ